MSSQSESWTIGVEEEYQIIDPLTRALCANADQLFMYLPPDADTPVHTELQRSQVEIATPICQTLTEVRATLLRARQLVIGAATAANLWIAAAGTHPFSHWNEQQLTATPRYAQMVQKYQQLVHEQVIFGCHVHVGCNDRERAIQIINRARVWLAPILALTANSPFWLGIDTGYASFRSVIWWRWPLAGPPGHFASDSDYNALVQLLVATSSIENTSHIYWDIRRSEHFPTVEFRIMDVCMTVDEAVMTAGLIRALVKTCSQQIEQNIPYPIVHTEILRAAQWRAARYGLDAELIDINNEVSLPAHTVIYRLLDMVRPALENAGEWEEISSLVTMTIQHGTGATRQRAVYQTTRRMEDVIDFIVLETAKGGAFQP